jgi:hypothetical protein
MQDAHLAALGLLDPDDQLAFEIALAAAPSHVRAQVRGEIERLSSGDGLLPDVTPDASLRERVIESVGTAMVDDAILHGERVAPAFSFAGAPQQDEVLLSDEVGQVHRRGGVSSMWRVGAISMLSAAAVLAAAFVFVVRTNQTMERTFAQNKNISNQFEVFGGNLAFDAAFNADTRRVLFESVDESFSGQVAVFVNERTGRGSLLAKDLPTVEGEVYHVVVINDKNEIIAKGAQFEGGALFREESAVEGLRAGTKLALVRATRGIAPTADRILAVATV